jgi:hypothetical protein
LAARQLRHAILNANQQPRFIVAVEGAFFGRHAVEERAAPGAFSEVTQDLFLPFLGKHTGAGRAKQLDRWIRAMPRSHDVESLFQIAERLLLLSIPPVGRRCHRLSFTGSSALRSSDSAY